DTLPADLAMTGSEAGGPIGSAIGCVGVIGSAGLTGLAISGADEGAARADFSSCTAASSPTTRSLRYRQRSRSSARSCFRLRRPRQTSTQGPKSTNRPTAPKKTISSNLFRSFYVGPGEDQRNIGVGFYY